MNTKAAREIKALRRQKADRAKFFACAAYQERAAANYETMYARAGKPEAGAALIAELREAAVEIRAAAPAI